MAIYATFKEAIDSYLGLTPTALFTILALMVGAYILVSSLFVSPDEAADSEKRSSSPIPEPVTAPAEPALLGDVTVEELKAFDGSDPKKPLLMAIKGNVYDVSRGRMFYGPGGPYALFAGRDASRALALMSFDPIDLTGNLEGLSSSELEVLQDWEYKFMEKYVKVGQLVSDKTINKAVNQSSKESGGVQSSERGVDEACKNIETREMEMDGSES